MPGYVYAQRDDAIWVNLYVASTADIKTGQRPHREDGAGDALPVGRRGEDDRRRPTRPPRSTINVRIPGWARNEPVASDLYRFADKNTEPVVLKVNGKAVPVKLDKGYVDLTRTWKKGDTIELNLPMPVRRVVANDHVAADRGRVAIERGPIVYAAEWVDNPDGKVRNLMLPDTAQAHRRISSPTLLNGVEVVNGKAVALAYDAQGKVVQARAGFHRDSVLRLGQSRARPDDGVAARHRGESPGRCPIPPWRPPPRSRSPAGRSSAIVEVIKDGEIPAASNDHASYFDW